MEIQIATCLIRPSLHSLIHFYNRLPSNCWGRDSIENYRCRRHLFALQNLLFLSIVLKYSLILKYFFEQESCNFVCQLWCNSQVNHWSMIPDLRLSAMNLIKIVPLLKLQLHNFSGYVNPCNRFDVLPSVSHVSAEHARETPVFLNCPYVGPHTTNAQLNLCLKPSTQSIFRSRAIFLNFGCLSFVWIFRIPVSEKA